MRWSSIAPTLAVLGALTSVAHAEPWSGSGVRERAIGVALLSTRSGTLDDGAGMLGGRANLFMRVSPRWSFEWGLDGHGGHAAGGYLAGGWSMSLAPEVHCYLAPGSRIQPYLLAGYELSVQYLRAGSDIPSSARPGFLYSGPNGGAGVDVYLSRDVAVRLDVRGFAMIRGYPDDMLKDDGALADATRWLKGVTVTSGVVIGMGRL